DVGRVDTLRPGMHIYPNRIVIPQDPHKYQRVLELLQGHFVLAGGSPLQLERLASDGIEIHAAAARTLAALIKTGSKNTCRDSTISAVIGKVAEKFDDRVMLRFRTARRLVREEGLISTGTLSGDELRAARAFHIPTLWIMAATTTEGSAGGVGRLFMY